MGYKERSDRLRGGHLSIMAVGLLATAILFFGLPSPIKAAVALQNLPNARSSSTSCPIDLPLSCHNSTPIANSCCFEGLGGLFLLTQFWDYNPAIGGNETFTLHGLWSDYCDGTYGQYCNPSMEIQSAQDIILNQFQDQALYNDMNTYWLTNSGSNDDFWVHEFNKHATCMDTVNPDCFPGTPENYDVVTFFQIAVNLYKTLPTFEFLAAAGIYPSDTVTYTKEQISDALSLAHGGNEVYFACDSNQALNEVWYYYYLNGPLINQNFVATATPLGSNCPDTGIKYPTKLSGSGSPSDPGSGDSSKGFLQSADESGCVISGGNWYKTGTCATFTIAESQYGGVSVQSSKGYCGIVNNQFVCNSSISESQYQFAIDSLTEVLSYGGNSDWCLGQPTGLSGQEQWPITLGGCSLPITITFNSQ